MRDYKPFSVDSHVTEPRDLWTSRMPKYYRDRAPRMTKMAGEDGVERDYFVFEGFPPINLAIGMAAAAKDERGNYVKRQGSMDEALPGGWDPVERLKDQDIDGIEGEVLHPTQGFRLFWLKDSGLQRAACRAYNEWLAELVSHNPRRLVGVACIPLCDVPLGVEELRLSHKQGLRGAMIWLSPPADHPFDSPEYDLFWAEAQELDVPIVLHVITGSGESRMSGIPLEKRPYITMATTGHEAQRSLATFILGGILERFPRLKLINAENGTGWIPFFIQNLDERTRRRVSNLPVQLSMKPSEYFQRNIWVSFINEPHTVEIRHQIGVDHLMWASDYPHFATTWPKSLDFLETELRGVDEVERRNIVRDTALKLYNLE